MQRDLLFQILVDRLVLPQNDPNAKLPDFMLGLFSENTPRLWQHKEAK